MTVVAFSSRHRTMAADSLCSTNAGDFVTTCQKIFRLKSGALLGLAGDPDARDLVQLLETCTPRRLPRRKQLAELEVSFSGLLAFPDGDVFCVDAAYWDAYGDWTGSVTQIKEQIAAIGCGQEYALGALEHGATPAEAVRIACKRNAFCALPVQSEKL